MKPYYEDASVTLYHGDCLEVLSSLPDASVDSVVTDPPYGLEFMGKEWDAPWKSSSTGRGARVATERAAELTERGKGHTTSAGPYLASGVDSTRVAGKPFQEWCELWATECLRILKPGGHMLAFGGTRTFHRLACAVEDAGFEIRDSIAWLYGSGFPKSMDVSKAIDKAAGAERPTYPRPAFGGTFSDDNGTTYGQAIDGMPITPEAERWQGWGTALKPAFEPVVVGRKPLGQTVAANVLAHGTGALNIDGCRVGGAFKSGWSDAPGTKSRGGIMNVTDEEREARPDNPSGRWPANVVLDVSQAEALDEQAGELTSGANPTKRGSDKFRDSYGDFKGQEECEPARGADTGGASRFFYVAKAPSAERLKVGGVAHPTVKPIDLMRWLVRLVTPPGGTVLEPFAGSGTTVEACILEGFDCIAIEREDTYLPLITQRINRRRDPVAYVKASGDDGGLFDLFSQGESA